MFCFRTKKRSAFKTQSVLSQKLTKLHSRTDSLFSSRWSIYLKNRPFPDIDGEQSFNSNVNFLSIKIFVKEHMRCFLECGWNCAFFESFMQEKHCRTWCRFIHFQIVAKPQRFFGKHSFHSNESKNTIFADCGFTLAIAPAFTLYSFELRVSPV